MLSIPRLGLGTWKSPDTEVLKRAIIFAVEKAGYRHIDCAEAYGNEKTVGDAVHDLLSRHVVRREDLWITSKVWNTHHEPAEVAKAIRRTCENLQVDYIDLYLMHYPCAFPLIEGKGDFPSDEKTGAPIITKTPIIDTWNAMEKCVREGYSRFIGVSNFTINQLEQLRYNPKAKLQPYTNQVEHHLYFQQWPMLEYLGKRGIVLTSYSSLGSGDFVGPDAPRVLQDKVLKEVAREVGRSPAQVELRFLQQLGNVSTLAMSIKNEELAENNRLDFYLNDAQMDRLRSRQRAQRLLDFRPMWKCDIQADGW